MYLWKYSIIFHTHKYNSNAYLNKYIGDILQWMKTSKKTIVFQTPKKKTRLPTLLRSSWTPNLLDELKFPEKEE